MSTFSLTVRVGNSPLDCGTWATPALVISAEREPVDALAVDQDGAAHDLQQPADRAEDGRLAGAVGADDAGDRRPVSTSRSTPWSTSPPP